MWPKSYRDYPEDTSLIKNKVESGRSIVGCEMHDLNGWGTSYHISHDSKKKKGLIRTLLDEITSYIPSKHK
jgi:hypothetical protein